MLRAWDRAPGQGSAGLPDGRKTYDEVVPGPLRRARGLIGLGVKPGDHVGVLLPSGIEFVETLFASAMIGGGLGADERALQGAGNAYVAENADLTAIVTDERVRRIVDFGGRLTEAFPALAEAAIPRADPRRGAEAAAAGAVRRRRAGPASSIRPASTRRRRHDRR